MTDNQSKVLQMVQHVAEGQSFSEDQARQFFGHVVNGDVDDLLLSSALTALKVRGETPGELAGAAMALLDSAKPFPKPEFEFADVVGTGGDGFNTINLSTISAITAATCGAKIIKHGNRSISSVSGSFDLLEKLGVDFSVSAETARQQVTEHGICFLYAPNYHPGVRHASTARKTLKVRTIFNLLGPLVNPARPPRMVLGVADYSLLSPIATVLARLGCQHALVVHGSKTDEVAIHGPTSVVELKQGKLNQFELTVEDLGAVPHSLDDLVCHEADLSHQRSMAVLAGQGSEAEQAAVGVNVSLILKLFGKEDLKNNYALARESLSAGRPMELIQQLVQSQS